MKFGNATVYVSDVGASLSFFEQAFGLKIRGMHESGMYGELDTGETVLAFAAHEVGPMRFSGGHVAGDASARPLGVQLSLVTNDVQAAHARALATGATELGGLITKPCGQLATYVRCPDGTLVELCTPEPAPTC